VLFVALYVKLHNAAIVTLDPAFGDQSLLATFSEAEEHLRLAAKALKTGLLKWNPDYDTAGDEYSRAATAFKVSETYIQVFSPTGISVTQSCQIFLAPNIPNYTK
jgi:hypothetical protein